MKRASKDTAQDYRNQAITETLIQNDDTLVFIVPAFILSFRNHPWRLLRLMSVSRMAYDYINGVIESSFKNLWFDICINQFPDVVIMIDVMKKKSTKYRPDYIRTVPYTPDVNKIIHCADTPTKTFKYQNRGLAYGLIDDSFLDDALLDECWRSEEKARKMSHAFSLVYPIGIPPAAYCFSSQVALYECTLQFLEHVGGGPMYPAWYDIVNDFTIFNVSLLRQPDLQSKTTLATVESSIKGHFTFEDLKGLVLKWLFYDADAKEAMLLRIDEEAKKPDGRYIASLEWDKLIDWKAVVTGQIKWLDIYGKEKAQFINIQAVCQHCQCIENLHVEAGVPFGIYCSLSCQQLSNQ
jgi:hypothetical protein